MSEQHGLGLSGAPLPAERSILPLGSSPAKLSRMRIFPSLVCRCAAAAALLHLGIGFAQAQSSTGFQICVSNEKSGDITLIDGASRKVVATIPVGKRPRGIVASPDGKIAYVALSGTPISGPPPLDAQGNPILRKAQDDDDDDDKKADKSADGIAVVDLASKSLLRKIHAGSDPEQFALSKDGSRLFVSNEDVGTASVLNIGTGKVEQIIPVHREPEGVCLSPDGSFFYVTCETDGEIFAVGTERYNVIAHFNVGGRPRSVAFLPDGTRAFIPSESAGEVHLIDTAKHAVLKTIKLPKGARPMCIKVAPDGRKVYASTGRGGTICVLDSATLEVLKMIQVGPRPWGIAISTDGKFLYSANGPSDDISIVDLAGEKEVGRVKAGQSPWGVVILPNQKPASYRIGPRPVLRAQRVDSTHGLRSFPTHFQYTAAVVGDQPRSGFSQTPPASATVCVQTQTSPEP